MSVDKGLEFESWICYEVPWRLRLSPSKEVAMGTYFSNFADRVRPLAKKATEEFDQFFKDLKEGLEKVSNYRAPKGKKIGVSITDSEIELHPNKRPIYRLYTKKP